MVITLLIACLAAILGVAVGAVVWKSRVEVRLEARLQAEKQAVSDQIYAFITAPDEATPSPFAQLVHISLAGAIPDLANAVTMSLKASLMGQASGIARGARAIEMGLQEAAMEDNPMAQVAAGLFEKQIKRNPMLGMGLQQLMARMAGSGGSAGSAAAAGSTSGSRPKFEL